MGYFTYDTNTRIEIDDRLLAHLQIVIGSKLRRDEPFFFTWRTGVGSARTTVWIHPGAGMKFTFSGSRMPAISQPWLNALTHTANQPQGLYEVHEPANVTASDHAELASRV